MKTHNELLQGSHLWHAFRAAHFPASEAPSMMGESPYKTRTQLLHEKHTGLVPEVDAATQRRFDDGHRFENLARPLAEEIIGEPLSPVTGSDGMLSASFDGISFMHDIVLEHKSLNDEIRAAKSAADLGLHYRIQMEQQLAVSGAEKCLFMATKWNDADELQEQVFHWYYPDMELRAQIIAGWDQFAKDLAEYQPREIAEKPKAEAILSLPALAIQIRGEVTLSNLPQFKEAASAFIANISTDLKTDEDFAQAEATVKFCKSAEDDLEAAKKAAIGQTASIDELMRTIDHIQAQLRDKRLVLDRLVKSEKEAIKNRIIEEARGKFSAHILSLDDELRGHGVRLICQNPDFGGAVKNKRTLASLHDSVDAALAQGKIAADSLASEIRARIRWFKENGGSQLMILFPDLGDIAYKADEDFKLLVETRIANHKHAEAEKLETDRKRIQAEEEAKAVAKTAAKADDVKQDQPADLNQPEPAKPAPVANMRAAVIEHQDEIAKFFKSRTFSTQKENEYRAVIVEFIKFTSAAHAMKNAA